MDEGEYTFSVARSVMDVRSTVDVKIGAHRWGTEPRWPKLPDSSSPVLDPDYSAIPQTKEAYIAETKEQDGPATSRRLALLPKASQPAGSID